jgi:hypothetical protein
MSLCIDPFLMRKSCQKGACALLIGAYRKAQCAFAVRIGFPVIARQCAMTRKSNGACGA